MRSAAFPQGGFTPPEQIKSIRGPRAACRVGIGDGGGNIVVTGTPEEVARVAPEVWEGLPIGPDGEVAGPDEPDEDWYADFLRYGPDDAGPDSLD